MRLAVITTSLGVGGAEAMLFKLLTRLNSNMYNIEVFSLLGEEYFAERLRNHGIVVHTTGTATRLKRIFRLLRFRKKLAQFNPDVVQGWMYHGNLAATTLCWSLSLNKPVYWGIRQSLSAYSNERKTTTLVIWLLAKISRSVSAIIYNSSLGAKHHEAIGFDAARRFIIPNGFDTDLFYPSARKRREMREIIGLLNDEIAVAIVARYHPVKDHSGFLAAAKIVESSVPKAVFVLVGTDVDYANKTLCTKLKEYSLNNRVLLLGEREDISDLLRAFDVLVSSSVAEGFPNVVGEAMATGVPCIVTDVGDCATIVGQTGYVVPPSCPKALANAVVSLASMPAEGRFQLGLRARECIRNSYSIEVIIRAYEKLYDCAL